MNAKLTILGCRSGAPSTGAAASGYLIQIDNRTILMDCGPGVVLALSQQNFVPALDAVIISHRHADHCADLLALAYQRRFPEIQPPLPLFGPPDLAIVLDGLDALFGMPSLSSLARPLHDTYAFHPITPGESFACAGQQVHTCAAQHPVPTLTIRWPDVGLVYTADTALTPTITAFASKANLLLAEATYLTPDGHDLHGHGHLTAAQSGELAQRAQVAHLVLTHLADAANAIASYEQASRCFKGPITIATAGMVLPLERH
ncbi:MAG: MBL fold metallo-hydrolase [Oscillochloris sp.]|nr:MBL fold metallo-hydrolase [Oscillochloris sp.]